MSEDEVKRIRVANNNTAVSRVFADKAGESPPIPNPVTVSLLAHIFSIFFIVGITIK